MKIRGIGVDLCKCSRIADSYKRFGERFLQRAFHFNEVSELHASRSSSPDEVAKFLASRCLHAGFSVDYILEAGLSMSYHHRWAAKEAVYKAFATKRLLFPEIEIVGGNATSAPRVQLHGAAAAEFTNKNVEVRHSCHEPNRANAVEFSSLTATAVWCHWCAVLACRAYTCQYHMKKTMLSRL